MHVHVVPLYAWCVVAGSIEMVLADVSDSVVAEQPQEDISEEHAEGNKPFGFLCLTCCCLCMVGARVEGTVHELQVHKVLV